MTETEENYLKAIYKLAEKEPADKPVSTNAIAGLLGTTPASVTDMIKRLAQKELVHYKSHRGVSLNHPGHELAVNLVRKHRLWEVFLVEKLQFSWDEVHDIAEQLEHIHSPELIQRLDRFLGHPRFDPHGDPIPDAEGNFTERKQIILALTGPGTSGVIVGVNEHSPPFLQYLDRMQLTIGTPLKVLEVFEFDGSMKVLIQHEREVVLSPKIVENLYIQKKNIS